MAGRAMPRTRNNDHQSTWKRADMTDKTLFEPSATSRPSTRVLSVLPYAMPSTRRSAPSTPHRESAGSLRTCTRAAGVQWFREPVPAEGVIVSRIRRASGVFNARVVKGRTPAHASKSSVCQSVAGIAVAEKNRCLRISAPGAWSVAARHQSSGLAGTISGTIQGAVGGRVSRNLVYT
jgi:hypothetical protein